MPPKPKLVEMVGEICKACTSFREQAVELIFLRDERRCPFFHQKTARCGDYDTCRIKPISGGVENDCKGMANIPSDCPIRKSPYYHEGKVYLVGGLSYTPA